jgi:DNA (cytosine-5)-methyltransferase 1
MGIDNDRDAADTYRANFPEAKFLEIDVRQLAASDLKPLLPTGPLLFAGCAPCQPFSRQNRNKKTTDPRRDLLSEFARILIAIRPEYIIVENVPGLQRVTRSGPLHAFVRRLMRTGYQVSIDVLRALDFGVPQERRRLVVVAALAEEPALPVPTHGPGLLRTATVRDFVRGLPPLASGETDERDPDHVAMALSEMNLKRIRSTPEGGDRRNWPKKLLLECHSQHKGHTDVYGRMSWDKPASGLTTRCISYSNGRFGHPDQDRAISVREAACLQTFPRSFRFSGSPTSKARQIGNAVPPLMAQRIVEALTGD